MYGEQLWGVTDHGEGVHEGGDEDQGGRLPGGTSVSSAPHTCDCPRVFNRALFPPLLSRVQFVCIAQQDYCCILNQVEKNMQKVEEEGEIVMVKEHRELDRTGTRKGHIVIKVTYQQ